MVSQQNEKSTQVHTFLVVTSPRRYLHTAVYVRNDCCCQEELQNSLSGCLSDD